MSHNVELPNPPPTHRPRHQHSRSQQLTSTQPSLTSRRHQQHHSISISSGSPRGFLDHFLHQPSQPHGPVPTSPLPTSNTSIDIEFDGDTQVIIRPNRVVKGKVVLHAVDRVYLTRIRIKFYAQETAMIKLDDGLCQQATTTFFETEHTVWGDEMKPYAQSPWEEVDAGKHEFPFTLKFPNVNYPPSVDDPPGFSIRYIWCAHADGPAGQINTMSKKCFTPYRPIIAAPPDKDWTFRTTLFKDSHGIKKQHALAQLVAKFNKQCYCPDELLSMQLTTVPLNSDIKITNITYKFRRHHQGRLTTQRGTAVRQQTHELLDATISAPVSQQSSVVFSIPTLMVSPTFSSRHVRTMYDLLLRVTMEETHFLKRSTTFHCECSIPIHIANLPHDEMMRIPDLLSIEQYTQSKLSPFFYGEYEAECNNTSSPPPGYYSGHDRQQHTVYMSMQTSPKFNSNGCSAVTPTTTTSNISLINGNNGAGLMGCSSSTAHSHHQRVGSFPDIGEANILLSSSDEWS
ncbi:hypothetical protein K492DRAFT_139681 [Lichtheimia hyalospora FSU 10163]|nr:hypothetical protein K492DRAFT_139681 [Lichtheimia hyalospora FSU 10163]